MILNDMNLMRKATAGSMVDYLDAGQQKQMSPIVFRMVS